MPTLNRPAAPPETSRRQAGAIDWLYLGLGGFTHLYGITLSVLFISRGGGQWPVLDGMLDALQEPYLGGLGIYVVLKELRKRTSHVKSRHSGEYFVAAWLGLLVLATLLVIFSLDYRFDDIYKIIITNSLATGLIYLGGVIVK